MQRNDRKGVSIMSATTNAQLRLGIRLFINNDLGLTTEIDGPRISVKLQGGSFRVIYKKPLESSQLVLDSEWWREDSQRTLTHLRARAWRLANDTATKLGWFSGT